MEMIHSFIQQHLIEGSGSDLFLSSISARIESGSGIICIPSVEFEESQLKNWVIQMLHQNGKSFDAKTPYVDFVCEISSHTIRGHALFPPLCKNLEISLRILRNPKNSFWQKDPYFSLLREKFFQQKTILIAGATGCGKTTLARELLQTLPSSLRILSLEDSPELNCEHPGYLSLRTREKNADGFGEVTLKDLLRQTLRMRPDRIILGECRGDEVLELLQTLNTGHSGSLATIHANSTRDALRRIELLSMMHPNGARFPIRAIRELLFNGIQYVVHLKRDEQSLRKISSVSEIVGMEGETLLIRDL